MNKNNNTPMSDTAVTMRVSKISIFYNALLTVFKLLAGILANSSAMVADAVHSASDIVSTVVVMIAANISGKEADAEHPYGHERMECIASIILANLLGIVGLGIGYAGIMKIFSAQATQVPGMLALIAAIVSIVIKEGMFWYTIRYAKKINSLLLRADAWHHRSDAMSSIGSFIGILGARMGVPIMDPLASVVISLFILKVTFDIYRESLDKLVDRSCAAATVEQLRADVLACAGVCVLENIRTRQFGSKIYVDLEIGVDSALSLREAHEIAEMVHVCLEQKYGSIKHCMVHYSPHQAQQLIDTAAHGEMIGESIAIVEPINAITEQSR